MLAPRQLFFIVALSAFFTVASAQARAECTRNGTVRAGDICDSLSARDKVSTYQLANANLNFIDSGCSNLQPGDKLCLGIKGEDCTSVAVMRTHGACSSMATHAGVSLSRLLENNPNLKEDCSNGYVGMVLCVARDLYKYTGK